MAGTSANASGGPARDEKEIRRIIIVNHGETVDKVFGQSWAKFYDDDGNLKCSRAFSSANYVTFEDGNLPISLLDRADGMKMYDRDPPLTEVGKIGCLEVGYALGAAGITMNKTGGFVYCSPTCACVESAHYVCKGMSMAVTADRQKSLQDKDDFTLRIENGFLPQIGHDARLTPRNLPKWLAADEIQFGLGRAVDTSYKQVIGGELNQETVEDCYARMRKTTEKLLLTVPSRQGQTLLIVGHPSTIEGCTRHLYNGPLRRQRDFDAIIRTIPFCTSIRMSERSLSNWQMTEPLVPALTHAANDAYRWEAFGDPNEMRKVLKK